MVKERRPIHIQCVFLSLYLNLEINLGKNRITMLHVRGIIYYKSAPRFLPLATTIVDSELSSQLSSTRGLVVGCRLFKYVTT